MSLPKKISIEINKKEKNDNKLFQVIMYKGKKKVVAYSSDLKKAINRAVDYFETKFK